MGAPETLRPATIDPNAPAIPDGWPDRGLTRWPWSRAEIAVLRAHYHRGLAAVLPLLPARRDITVMAKARALGLARPHVPEGDPTPEIDAGIRAHYAQPYDRRRGGMPDLVRRLGRSRQWIRQRAIVLGCRVAPLRSAPWTPEEDAWISERRHLAYATLAKRMRALGRGWSRSEAAISERLAALGLRGDRRPEDHDYTADELAAAMGTDIHRVLRWLRRGILRGHQAHGRVGDPWVIRHADVRAMLIRHPSEWDHRGADHLWLIDILAGRVGGPIDY